MNVDTPLWKSHDVAEKLQNKIEALPGVERAFVHVDYETSHAPVRIFPSASATSDSAHLTYLSQCRSTGNRRDTYVQCELFLGYYEA